MDGMMENTFINVKKPLGHHHCRVDDSGGGANGAILRKAAASAAGALYVKDGKPAYIYNFVGLHAVHHRLAPRASAEAAGKPSIMLEFAYDGGGAGKGGEAHYLVNGKAWARVTRREDSTQHLSADEAADVGVDDRTPMCAPRTGIGPETVSPARSTRSARGAVKAGAALMSLPWPARLRRPVPSNTPGL